MILDLNYQAAWKTKHVGGHRCSEMLRARDGLSMMQLAILTLEEDDSSHIQHIQHIARHSLISDAFQQLPTRSAGAAAGRRVCCFRRPRKIEEIVWDRLFEKELAFGILEAKPSRMKVEKEGWRILSVPP